MTAGLKLSQQGQALWKMFARAVPGVVSNYGHSVYLRQATCFYKLNYMKLELMLIDSIKLLII